MKLNNRSSDQWISLIWLVAAALAFFIVPKMAVGQVVQISVVINMVLVAELYKITYLMQERR